MSTVRTRFCPSPTGMLHVGAHADGAVQLGVRPAHRRHLRVPHRGHRRRPRLRGVLPAPARLPALARPGLGRGPRGRRPERPVPAVGAARHLRATSPPSCWPPGTPTSRSRPTRRSTPAAAPPARTRSSATTTTTAILTDEQKAAFRAEGREPVLRLRMPDEDLVWTDLVRGEVRFAAGSVPDFVAGPRQRRAALPARQPGRRRADGHHPRAARRGPAALHPAADRAVRGADRHRRRRGHAAVRPPAARDGRGQQEAVQARPAVELRRLPRARLPARGPGQLPRAARLVDRRRPRHLLDGRDGRGLRRHAGQRQPGPLRPEEGRGDQRHPPARAAGRGVRRRASSRSWPRPGWSASRRRRSRTACCGPSPRWRRSA